MARSKNLLRGVMNRLIQLPTLPFLWFERAQGPLRIVLLLVYATIAVPLLLLLARSAMLNGLPDPGPPIDLDAYRAQRRGINLDPEANAAIWYQRALKSFVAPGAQALQIEDLRHDSRLRVMPNVELHLARNRETLQLWLEGTERELIAPEHSEGIEADSNRWPISKELAVVGELAARILMTSDEPEYAWPYLIGLLRYAQHCRIARGPIDDDLPLLNQRVGNARSLDDGYLLTEQAVRLIREWLDRPTLSQEMIRRALDDVEAVVTLAEPSDLLKYHYVRIEKTLDHPSARLEKLGEGLYQEWQGTVILGNPGLPEFVESSVLPIAALERHGPDLPPRFLLNDPERSRRVLRLIFQNWLAHCDSTSGTQPRIVEPDPFVQLFNDPETMVIAPGELGDWLKTAPMAVILLADAYRLWSMIAEERLILAELQMDLAERLYYGDYGHYPTERTELIGKYLDQLPEGLNGNPMLLESSIGLPMIEEPSL